jgi:nucleoside phosphorylase
MVDAGARPVTIATSDLFYDPREDHGAELVARGAVAVEMEAATVLQVAALRGVTAACVLGVSDVAGANGARRMSRDELTELGLRVGEAGYAAVTNP